MSGFAIRPMVKADEPFIFKAWLEGYWDAGAGGAVLIMRKSEWLPRWHLLIEIILVNPRTCTVVAHVGDKPDYTCCAGYDDGSCKKNSGIYTIVCRIC